MLNSGNDQLLADVLDFTDSIHMTDMLLCHSQACAREMVSLAISAASPENFTRIFGAVLKDSMEKPGGLDKLVKFMWDRHQQVNAFDNKDLEEIAQFKENNSPGAAGSPAKAANVDAADSSMDLSSTAASTVLREKMDNRMQMTESVEGKMLRTPERLTKKGAAPKPELETGFNSTMSTDSNLIINVQEVVRTFEGLAAADSKLLSVECKESLIFEPRKKQASGAERCAKLDLRVFYLPFIVRALKDCGSSNFVTSTVDLMKHLCRFGAKEEGGHCKFTDPVYERLASSILKAVPLAKVLSCQSFDVNLADQLLFNLLRLSSDWEPLAEAIAQAEFERGDSDLGMSLPMLEMALACLGKVDLVKQLVEKLRTEQSEGERWAHVTVALCNFQNLDVLRQLGPAVLDPEYNYSAVMQKFFSSK